MLPPLLMCLAGVSKTSNELFQTIVSAFDYSQRTSQCSRPSLGYKYKKISESGLRSGTLGSMTFIKRRDNTILRLSFATNMRVYYSKSASRWFLKIDGHECTDPGRVEVAMYQQHRNDLNMPSILKGVCTATTSGRIKKGQHTISIHIGRDRQNNNNLGSTYTGWHATSLLEVQEVCPPQ